MVWGDGDSAQEIPSLQQVEDETKVMMESRPFHCDCVCKYGSNA